MTNPKKPVSYPEDEEMDPVGEPYPEQWPLNPEDGEKPPEKHFPPFNKPESPPLLK